MNLSALRRRVRGNREAPSPEVLARIEREWEKMNEQVADGTIGNGALNREEFAEKYGKLLGRD